MKITNQLLKSKVARRILVLFVLSSVIPLATIYLITLSHVSETLEQETSRQLYRESRALGLSIYDRLLLLESTLKTVEKSLLENSDIRDYKNDEWLMMLFRSLSVKQDGVYQKLFGNFADINNFDASEQKHLDNGNSLLFINSENNTNSLLLIRKIFNSDQSPALIIGEIEPDYLWQLGVYSPDALFVLDEAGTFIYSSSIVDEASKQSLLNLQLVSNDKKELKNWTFNNQPYAVNGWNLFLKARFLANDLTIVFSSPEKIIFSRGQQFKKIFPQVLIITGLLIALLSISLIRKSLRPIEKLMQGTRNISAGDYKTPVVIRSNDEFEELANSFNIMSRRINEQFRTLEILSSIDRLILSTMDKNQIIETLIKYLNEIIPAQHIAVATILNYHEGNTELNINIDSDFSDIESHEIILNTDELQELSDCHAYISFDNSIDRIYTKHQRILGDKFFLIFPVKNNDQLAGLICISSQDAMNLESRSLEQLRELADRTSVALSNAAWEEKLYKQAHYDSLSNLPNRFLFKDRLEQSIESARRNGTNVAVMFIDLDRFKTINDTLGHSTGDQLIQEVAKLLLQCVRKYDTVARFGGDEYLIIIPDIKKIDIALKRASRVASRILERMSTPFILDQRNIYMSASIGITIFPRDANDYDGLLMNADAAMYQAKEKGRNDYFFYSNENNQNGLERLDLENDLRHAIAKNELKLLYQPKIDVQSNQIIGVEALIRWDHPQLGTVNPDEFINLAEECGLIAEIGYWVLEKACWQNKTWQENNKINIHTAVNVSTDQFREIDFFEKVSRIVSESGLSADSIELEITESITIENSDKTVSLLKKFREIGISISIDDFGTGFSSLSYLQQFPIDNLKIDRSFIHDIPFNQNNISIINAIIALAHSLNMKTIAEGVETKEQQKLLKEMDCDQVQGYVITEPLTSDDLVKFTLDYNHISDTGSEDE